MQHQPTEINYCNEEYKHSLPVGFPSPALDYLKAPIDIRELIAPRPLSTFYFLCEGVSMKDVIPEKALLVVDTSLKAGNWDIIIAFISGEWTVRFIVFENNQCLLIAANPAYENILVTEEMQLKVWGVVTQIIINPKTIQHVCLDRL